MAASGPRALPFLLFLVATLAGCVGEEDIQTPGDAPLEGGPPLDEDGLPVDLFATAPAWALHDHWTFRPTIGDPVDFVVTAVTPTDYFLDTNGDFNAFFNALGDVSTLGEQRKSDLAGSQGSDRVLFFKWPMTDGATWTTNWDQEAMTITAAKKSDDVYEMSAARADGSPYARYEYSAKARWFQTLAFLDDEGQEAFKWELVGSGSNYTGELRRYSIEHVFGRATGAATTPFDAVLQEFTLPDSATDVFLMYFASCTDGVIDLEIHHESDTQSTGGYGERTQCPGSAAWAGPIGDAKGSWGLTWAQATATPPQYSIDVWLRTLTVISVP